jgi:hypothetical protein
MRQKEIERIRAAAREILALTDKIETQASTPVPAPAPRPGRKPSLDQAGIEKALALLDAGYSKPSVAAACSVSVGTIVNWFEYSPRLKKWRLKAKK